jgi:hypothetical protein
MGSHPPRTVPNPEVVRDHRAVNDTRRAGNGTSGVVSPTHCATCAALGQAVLAAPGASVCPTHLATPDYRPSRGGRRTATATLAGRLTGRLTVSSPPSHTCEQGVCACAALMVETARSGQNRLQLPSVPRQFPASWDRKPCAVCARASVDDRPGEPRSGAGSEALCLPCWRGRSDRAARQALRAAETWAWEHAGDVDPAELVCPACGADEPTPECWLCGWTWLQQARREFELDQAAEAAATAAEFARIAATTEAEAHIAWLEGWLKHAQGVVAAYREGRGWGRPVELVADLMARDAAARTTMRGRPPEARARIAAVMALDSDPRSGRRSMPGRDETALLAGCDKRTVTSEWKHQEAGLGWLTRTQKGRKLTFAERVACGRGQNRTMFDLAPLHRSPVDTDTRALWAPLALAAIGDLIETTLSMLSAAYEALDGLRARSGADVDWAEQTRRARMRQIAARAAATALDIDGNFFPPRTASRAEYVSSCSYWGLTFSRENSRLLGGRPVGRRGDGASRSPAQSSKADLEGSGSTVGGHTRSSHPVRRPRTLQATRPAPRKPAPRPDWVDWAPDLARDLRELWPWLAEVPLTWITATLGAALGRDWTAAALDAWVRARHGALLETPARPARYLKTLLAEVLTGDAEPPHPSRLASQARRERVAEQAAQLREHQAAARAEAARQEDAAWLSQAGMSARDAARAIAARAASTQPPAAPAPAPRPRPESRPGQHLPVAAALGVRCDVAWHGCLGEVSAWQEPWPGGHLRHYCQACATSVTAAW